MWSYRLYQYPSPSSSSLVYGQGGLDEAKLTNIPPELIATLVYRALETGRNLPPLESTEEVRQALQNFLPPSLHATPGSTDLPNVTCSWLNYEDQYSSATRGSRHERSGSFSKTIGGSPTSGKSTGGNQSGPSSQEEPRAGGSKGERSGRRRSRSAGGLPSVLMLEALSRRRLDALQQLHAACPQLLASIPLFDPLRPQHQHQRLRSSTDGPLPASGSQYQYCYSCHEVASSPSFTIKNNHCPLHKTSHLLDLAAGNRALLVFVLENHPDVQPLLLVENSKADTHRSLSPSDLSIGRAPSVGSDVRMAAHDPAKDLDPTSPVTVCLRKNNPELLQYLLFKHLWQHFLLDEVYKLPQNSLVPDVDPCELQTCPDCPWLLLCTALIGCPYLLDLILAGKFCPFRTLHTGHEPANHPLPAPALALNSQLCSTSDALLAAGVRGEETPDSADSDMTYMSETSTPSRPRSTGALPPFDPTSTPTLTLSPPPPLLTTPPGVRAAPEPEAKRSRVSFGQVLATPHQGQSDPAVLVADGSTEQTSNLQPGPSRSSTAKRTTVCPSFNDPDSPGDSRQRKAAGDAFRASISGVDKPGHTSRGSEQMDKGSGLQPQPGHSASESRQKGESSSRNLDVRFISPDDIVLAFEDGRTGHRSLPSQGYSALSLQLSSSNTTVLSDSSDEARTRPPMTSRSGKISRPGSAVGLERSRVYHHFTEFDSRAPTMEQPPSRREGAQNGAAETRQPERRQTDSSSSPSAGASRELNALQQPAERNGTQREETGHGREKSWSNPENGSLLRSKPAKNHVGIAQAPAASSACCSGAQGTRDVAGRTTRARAPESESHSKQEQEDEEEDKEGPRHKESSLGQKTSSSMKRNLSWVIPDPNVLVAVSLPIMDRWISRCMHVKVAPLHLACWRCDPHSIRVLLKHNADVTLCTEALESPEMRTEDNENVFDSHSSLPHSRGGSRRSSDDSLAELTLNFLSVNIHSSNFDVSASVNSLEDLLSKTKPRREEGSGGLSPLVFLALGMRSPPDFSLCLGKSLGLVLPTLPEIWGGQVDRSCPQAKDILLDCLHTLLDAGCDINKPATIFGKTFRPLELFLQPSVDLYYAPLMPRGGRDSAVLRYLDLERVAELVLSACWILLARGARLGPCYTSCMEWNLFRMDFMLLRNEAHQWRFLHLAIFLGLFPPLDPSFLLATSSADERSRAEAAGASRTPSTAAAGPLYEGLIPKISNCQADPGPSSGGEDITNRHLPPYSPLPARPSCVPWAPATVPRASSSSSSSSAASSAGGSATGRPGGVGPGSWSPSPPASGGPAGPVPGVSGARRPLPGEGVVLSFYNTTSTQVSVHEMPLEAARSALSAHRSSFHVPHARGSGLLSAPGSQHGPSRVRGASKLRSHNAHSDTDWGWGRAPPPPPSSLASSQQAPGPSRRPIGMQAAAGKTAAGQQQQQASGAGVGMGVPGPSSGNAALEAQMTLWALEERQRRCLERLVHNVVRLSLPAASLSLLMRFMCLPDLHLVAAITSHVARTTPQESGVDGALQQLNEALRYSLKVRTLRHSSKLVVLLAVRWRTTAVQSLPIPECLKRYLADAYC